MEDNTNVVDMNKSKPSYRGYVISGTVIVVTVLLAALVISNLFIVKQSEIKVVRQFGEIVRVIDEPGLNYKLPFIQSVTSIPKYNLVYNLPPAEINTLDKKMIMVDNYAIWRVVDAKKLIENGRALTIVEGRMGDIIYSNIRTELGRLNYDQIVNSEDSVRGSFNESVRNQVNMLLDRENYGIEVIDVRMKRTDLPESNEQAVYNRMISERESTAQEYLSQGDAEATKIRAETDREVTEMIALANAEAKIIIGEGEQEAARIYNAAYGKDPEFYSMYRTLESYQTTLDGEPVIMIPASSPYAQYLMGAGN
ncbi:protease modulator HflC [Bacillus horti]|uniref:Protein HflC n=1 Tax=Caldalkalibacillus horti TaxID=77523 RepID=A0ABT9VTF5_9BACI|nr:protease modulator HflC [Bacillus horti]MDQ0164165.1 membrane protease subunit HflC [Bacillus horti]